MKKTVIQIKACNVGVNTSKNVWRFPDVYVKI